MVPLFPPFFTVWPCLAPSSPVTHLYLLIFPRAGSNQAPCVASGLPEEGGGERRYWWAVLVTIIKGISSRLLLPKVDRLEPEPVDNTSTVLCQRSLRMEGIAHYFERFCAMKDEKYLFTGTWLSPCYQQLSSGRTENWIQFFTVSKCGVLVGQEGTEFGAVEQPRLCTGDKPGKQWSWNIAEKVKWQTRNAGAGGLPRCRFLPPRRFLPYRRFRIEVTLCTNRSE